MTKETSSSRWSVKRTDTSHPNTMRKVVDWHTSTIKCLRGPSPFDEDQAFAAIDTHLIGAHVAGVRAQGDLNDCAGSEHSAWHAACGGPRAATTPSASAVQIRAQLGREGSPVLLVTYKRLHNSVTVCWTQVHPRTAHVVQTAGHQHRPVGAHIDADAHAC